MRPQLKNGRLIAPSSIPEALDRLKEVHEELGKIKAQLADATRPLRYPSIADYSEWQDSAAAALKCFQSEQRQLCEWISDPSPLFKEAYALLVKLEDEVNFDPEEAVLMRKLDAHFDTKVRRTA